MTCKEVQQALSAWLDGEVADGAPVADHLRSCAACREIHETMKADDAAVREAFAPAVSESHRSADAFARAYRVPRSGLRLRQIVIPAVAAAAGLLVGLALNITVWREKPDEVPSQTQERAAKLESALKKLQHDHEQLAAGWEEYKRGGLGRLTCIMGEMEVKEQGAEKWAPAYPGMPLMPSTAVRTKSGTRSAVHLSDGSELRMNGKTEVTFVSAREAQLDAGEIWAGIQPAKEEYRVRTRDGQARVLGTEIGVQIGEKSTILMVFKGRAAFVNGRQQRLEAKAGEAVCADAVHITSAAIPNMDRATRWMTDILLSRGRDNPELDRQIVRLLEQMGETKIAYLSEEEIKSYGSVCAIPIARYIESPRCAEKPDVRKKAIRILADIGDWYAVDAYIKQLDDPDPEIRMIAAKGLSRVTGQTMGREGEFWKTGGAEERTSALKQWSEWWKNIRETRVTDNLERQLERVKKQFDR